MVTTPAQIRRSGRPARGGYEEYHPYGSTAWWAGSSTTVSQKRYRYTGMERDEETGLQCHGVKYYAPWLGRWTSADPIGLGDGVNRFGYCRRRPTAHLDPHGLQSVPGLLPLILLGSDTGTAGTTPSASEQAGARVGRDYGLFAADVEHFTAMLNAPIGGGSSLWEQASDAHKRQWGAAIQKEFSALPSLPQGKNATEAAQAAQGFEDGFQGGYNRGSVANLFLDLAPAAVIPTQIGVTETAIARLSTSVQRAGGAGELFSRLFRLSVGPGTGSPIGAGAALDPEMGSLLEEARFVRLYHRGELRGGPVPNDRYLATGRDRSAVEALELSGPVWEFRVPRDVLQKWISEGNARTLTDFDFATGVTNEEVRIAASVAEQMNNYLAKP